MMTKLNRPLAFTHALVIALGLLLLYGWMLTLPFFSDALYITSSRSSLSTPAGLLQIIDPHVDLATQEATRVTPLYRPVFLEVVVPLVQRLARSAAAVYGVVLLTSLCMAMAVYGLSFRLSHCQHSALIVAALVAFHPALFEAHLAGFAGLNGLIVYLFIVLCLTCVWIYAERPGWLPLAGLIGCAALAVFSWERVSLLAMGLPLLLVIAVLVARPLASAAWLERATVRELLSPRVLVLIVAGVAITGAYFLGRVIRFGAPMVSHHGSTTTVDGVVQQLGALVLGVVGIIPPYVGSWFGTNIAQLSLPSRLVFIAYAVAIVILALLSVRARPGVVALGLVLGALLIAPTFSASSLTSIRYADVLVLGLAVILSAAPLAPAITGERRFWFGLAAVVPLLLVGALFQSAQLGLPNHYLTRSARLASAVRDTAQGSAAISPGRQILLMGNFFNSDLMWIFNATPSRLGAFFDANFGVDRGRVSRFTPVALSGQPTVLVDYHYEQEGGQARPVGDVWVTRGLGEPAPVRWSNNAAFDCRSGDVLEIAGQRVANRSDNRQWIRVIFNRPGNGAFSILELFGDYQDVSRGETADQSRVYALVPPGTATCQVMPDGLAAGNAITEVQVLGRSG